MYLHTSMGECVGTFKEDTGIRPLRRTPFCYGYLYFSISLVFGQSPVKFILPVSTSSTLSSTRRNNCSGSGNGKMDSRGDAEGNQVNKLEARRRELEWRGKAFKLIIEVEPRELRRDMHDLVCSAWDARHQVCTFHLARRLCYTH